MTYQAQQIIIYDPLVHVAALGPMPNGKYGVYIGTYDTSPSGSVRPKVLLTSDGLFETVEEALKQGMTTLEEIRKEECEIVEDNGFEYTGWAQS